MSTRTILRNWAAAALLAAAPLSAAFTAAPAIAQDLGVPSGDYVMDKTHASITWKISHLGLADYTARFTGFDIQLTLDVENPANSKVTATIDPTTVETDYPGQKDFDGEIGTGAKYFNAGQFPQVTFTSTAIEPTGERTAKVTGDLTMLGVTKPVTLDVTLNGALAQHPFAKKPAVGFSGVAVIDRKEWGMTHLTNILQGTEFEVVGSKVTVLIEAEFIAK